MITILVVPHSNADAERVFSLVRKNDTDFRPNLGVDLLESILVIKIDNLAKGIPCYKNTFSSKFLKRAKSSTYQNLKLKSDPHTSNDISGDVLKMLDDTYHTTKKN